MLTHAALWGAFLAAPVEACESLAGLLRPPLMEAAGMAEAVAAVELGSLLPALFLQQGRTLEAARAFFELATRASLPTKPAAGTGGDGGGSEHGAGAPSARALELRLNFFQQAIHAARLAVNRLGGAEVAAALGVDFMRTAEEHHHRAQLQLRITAELAALTAPAADGTGLHGARLVEIARSLKQPPAAVLEAQRAQLQPQP